MAQLRQAENFVEIEGYLAENNLEQTVFRNGSEGIKGSIIVQVPQKINGKELMTEVPINFITSKFTKKGKINPSWESLNEAIGTLKSIAATGSLETADKVYITGAELRNNAFVGRDGKVVDFTQIRGSFINKVRGPFSPKAQFTLEFMVANISRALDREGVELDPPKVIVNAIVPQWGGKVDIVKLQTSNPNVVGAIEGYWEPNSCYKANGRFNFTTETREVKEEVDFGEARTKTYTNTTREYLITGGTQEPIEEEFAFSIEEIQKALTERREYHESLKTKNSTKTTPSQEKKVSFDDIGF